TAMMDSRSSGCRDVLRVESKNFFFFSRRRRHTRLVSDWSSDVCSSDLHYMGDEGRGTVWEEIIVNAPPDVRLVALSATVANVKEIGRASCRERADRWQGFPPRHNVNGLRSNRGPTMPDVRTSCRR